jgi:DNA-binding Lrp family transcriptional regulator
VLRLVAERPGITVREIGAQLGVDATGLYRVVNRLTVDGRIRKDGTGLHPIETAPALDASAADVTATDPETADAGASAAVAPERSGSPEGNVAAEGAAAPEPGAAETTAESAPAKE